MRGLRTLQQAASCFVNEVAFYPFNFNDDVSAFSGIMFNLKSQGGFVEVLTLELDVRIEADTDLAIEVYSYDGDYTSVHGDPGAWDLLADTYLVLHPDSSGGAVLPSHDFRPFTLGDGEVKSLYVKMNGPWIDNSLNAFLEKGEVVPNDNEHVVIYPGAGLTEDFPISYDASLLPIFAGAFHLRTSGSCAEKPETKVQYLIATDRSATDDLLASISESVDMTMETIFRVDSQLVGLQNDHDLQQVESSISREVNYDLEKCRWTACSTIETTVIWTHAEDLDVNEFLYRMYTHTDMVTDEIQYVLPDGSLVRYIGKEATKVEFKFLLKDVKGGRGMDQSQEEYFTQHTLDFINSEAEDFTIQALALNIDEKNFISSFNEADDKEGGGEEDNEGGRRRLQDVGQLELDGRLLGTRYSYVSEAEFALHIQDLYFNPGKVRDYVQKMAFEVNFPGPMSEFDRHEFFDDLVMIDGKVEVRFGEEAQPTQAPTDPPEEDDEKLKNFINRTVDNVSDWKPLAWILIGVSIFLVFAAIASFLVVRCVKEHMESEKRKEERMVDKEFMRQEKRLEEIRRKKLMQQEMDGASVGYDPADQSFCNESFAESYMDDSMVFDGQGSMRCNAVLPGAGPVGPPPGSRRRFYGPALANIGNDSIEQPLGRMPPGGSFPGGISERMPPARNMSGDSSVLSSYSGYGDQRDRMSTGPR